MNSLYRKEQCQSPDPAPTSFAPSFAAVAAGLDRNVDKDIQSKCTLSAYFSLKKSVQCELRHHPTACVLSLSSNVKCFLRPDRSVSAWRDVVGSIHPPHQWVQIQHHRSFALHTSTTNNCILQWVGVSLVLVLFQPPTPLRKRFTISGWWTGELDLLGMLPAIILITGYSLFYSHYELMNWKNN